MRLRSIIITVLLLFIIIFIVIVLAVRKDNDGTYYQLFDSLIIVMLSIIVINDIFDKMADRRQRKKEQTFYNEQFSESVLASFEEKHHIRLPAGYREIVLNHRPYYIMILDDAFTISSNKLGDDYLQQPFPHTDAWNDRSLCDAEKGWNSDYYNPALTAGTIRMINIGCELYVILVITGEERGNIWIDFRINGQGIVPLKTEKQPRITCQELHATMMNSKRHKHSNIPESIITLINASIDNTTDE